jgi:hypothetical protein
MDEDTEDCFHQAGGCGCGLLGFVLTCWLTFRAYHMDGIVAALGWFFIGCAIIEVVVIWLSVLLIGMPLALIGVPLALMTQALRKRRGAQG